MTRGATIVSGVSSHEEIGRMESPWKLPRRLRLGRPQKLLLLLMLFCVFVVGFYSSVYKQDDDDLQYVILNPSNDSDELPNDYLVWNSKCHMLSMDPYDRSIRPFVKKEKFEACTTKPILSSISRKPNGSIYLFLDHDAAKDYENLSCYWAVITRPDSTAVNDTDFDSEIIVGDYQPFEDRVRLNESVQVVVTVCRDNASEEVYKNVHTVINPERVRHRLQNSSYQRDFHAKSESTTKGKPKPLSILMLGLDSVSRLNFYRTMPATRAYFQEREWAELRAYNKMGDNTFPNLMAILTGHNETTNSMCEDEPPHSLDRCPMIWYNFRNSGYATAFAEDTASINTFNNLKPGFVEPPTDYYLRPYVLASERLLSTRQRFSWTYCTGPELAADRIFDAAVDFAEAFVDKPNFGFFWTNSLSHEYVNGPSVYDTRFLAKLQDMENRGVMNNSMIVVLSDHGMRFGDSRDSFIGWYEERLPFVYVWLPQWFRDQNPYSYDALLVNQDRLTSPYDLYETLRDILHRAGGQAPASSGCPRCSSLFKPVPSERGCKDAGISPHWCTCAGLEPYNVADPIAIQGANAFVDYVNGVTESYTTNLGIRLCSELKLKRITRVKRMIDFDEQDSADKVLKLFYTLELTPGGGKFETTVSYHGQGRFTLREEEVSRINLYGHNAICLEKGHKKYCQCRLNVAYSILKWF